MKHFVHRKGIDITSGKKNEPNVKLYSHAHFALFCLLRYHESCQHCEQLECCFRVASVCCVR